ncbi:MAG: hypothetical protein ACI8TQ_003432 [Planctomycetota bacterium]|jgi:hypothetical protein
MMDIVNLRALVAPVVVALSAALPTSAQICPEEPNPLRIYNPGGAQSVCPCFVAGEEAGVVFEAPPEHYPIEILKVTMGWASLFGGAPQSLEQAIHIYPGGLPNPGVPQFSLLAPLLTDGAFNQFNISTTPGNRIINSGPFTVTLEFANANAGSAFSPSVFSAAPSCTGGKNVIFATPGGWLDACVAGVSGNWAFEVTYRQVNCEPLNRDVSTISLSTGGSQNMTLAAGPSRANWVHWMFGSFTGTTPGITFPSSGVNLPLNFDAYMKITINNPGFAIFGNFLGTLSPIDGSAFASFSLPPGTDPSLAGVTLNHAYVAAPTIGDVQFASNAKSVTLVM